MEGGAAGPPAPGGAHWLWRWAGEEEWLASARGALRDFVGGHKRELGHLGQRELAEIAEQCRCTSYRVSAPVAGGAGAGGDAGAVRVKAEISLELGGSRGKGKSREGVRLTLEYNASFEQKASDRALSVDMTIALVEGKAAAPLVEYQVSGPEAALQAHGAVEEEKILTDRAALQRSRDAALPALDEVHDWAELLCSIPLLPTYLQSRAMASAIEDVVEEMCWDEDEEDDEEEGGGGGQRREHIAGLSVAEDEQDEAGEEAPPSASGPSAGAHSEHADDGPKALSKRAQRQEKRAKKGQS